MKTRTVLSIFILLLIVSGMNAQEKRPVAVSPSSESGVAIVGQSTPTFSWSALPWAETYRVVVFKAAGGETMAYEDMESFGIAILNKEIQGPGLSWTPSEEERLGNGELYVWYVQAVDIYGAGIWSEGRMFVVEEGVRLPGGKEKVRERLREYGVWEETITGVLKGVTPGIGTQGLFRIQGTEGGNNTFYGQNAGASTTGWYNSFFGANAGRKNTTGSENTFLGYSAGYKNTGTHNAFLGSWAGYSNTKGSFNTFLGYSSGSKNTTGGKNTFVGWSSGYKNTTGSENTFLGNNSGYSNTTGQYNTFIGMVSGYKNTKGAYNTFIGQQAGRHNKVGKRNTFIGASSGYNSKGSGHTFIGYNTGFNAKGSNKLYIDNSSTNSPLIYGDFSLNKVRINGKLGVGKMPTHLLDVGTSGAYCDGGAWVDGSSREYKENIETLTTEEAMEAFEGLDPVKFRYKASKDEEHVGFIAEDVPELVATEDRKGLSAMDIVAVLTKVVQEQQTTLNEQQEALKAQQKTISEMKEMIEELRKEKQEK